MSFITITLAQIAAGEPTAQELFTKTKDNFDDHESRLNVVESAINTFPPIRFGVTNYIANLPATQVDIERIPYAITVLSGRILVFDAGSSGTLSIDLEYKRNSDPWTTIFSTLPSVAYTAGDYAMSTDGVISVPSLLLGDLVRLNINSGQAGNKAFAVLLDYERA